MKEMGAKVVGVSEQGHSIQGTDKSIFRDKYVMDDREWELLCTGLDKLGRVARDMGIALTFHHHMGTVVQTAAEIDRMMENTDPELVGLLFDSGHLAYCGEDYLAVLKKYAGRTRHVHLKDIRPEVVAKVKAENLSFLQGVRMGTFTVPGDETWTSPLFLRFWRTPATRDMCWWRRSRIRRWQIRWNMPLRRGST